LMPFAMQKFCITVASAAGSTSVQAGNELLDFKQPKNKTDATPKLKIFFMI